MTVYDLEKRATPGPWAADVSRVRSGDYEVANCYSRVDASIKRHATNKANARLVAHCRNHFMEALEMLHRVVYVAEADETTYLLPCGIEALIAKLENVE